VPVTNVRSHWSGGDLIFHEALSVRPLALYNILTIGDDAVTVGSATNDIDFKVFLGSTNYMLCDVGNARQYLYASSASISSSVSVEPFLMESTMAGIGGVGGRARFYMTTDVALGGWSNALKAEVTYGASGRTNGLGSAFCAEMTLSAGTTQGNYAPLELELSAATGASLGTATSFIYCNGGGTGVASTIDTTGNFLTLGTNLTVGSGKFIDTDISSVTGYAGLRVYIPTVGIRYLALISA